MKRLYVGCVCVIIGLLLGGCNNLFESPLPTVTQIPILQPVKTPLETPTATPKPASHLTILTLWLPGFLNPYAESNGAEELNAQLQTFSEYYPDIQVQVIVKKDAGPGSVYSMLRTTHKAAPEVLPDLVVLNQEDFSLAHEEDLLQPFDAAQFAQLHYYTPISQSELLQVNNYGIPFVMQAEQMVYRIGVASTKPFSWTDVLTGGYSLLFPAAQDAGMMSDTLLAIYLGSGGAVMDENGAPFLERASLENLYGFFDALMKRSLINTDRVLALSDVATCWENYQQGIGRLSPVPMGVYWSDPPRDSRPSWIPTPDGRPVTMTRVWSMALVNEDPQRQEAALLLAQWLTAPEQVARLTRATQLLPPQPQALRLWNLLPEETIFIETLLENSLPALPATVDLPVRRALQAGLTVLINDDVDTPEAAATHALTLLRQ